MIVLIAGGGRTAAQLATLLVAQNHEVHLVEPRREVLARIHRELPTEAVFEGNPTEPLVLEQAGIQKTQVIVACTTSDADNLAICFLARSRYQVPRTIARINNPRNAWLFDQRFHVDVALNQSEILASLIEEEMSLGDMMTLLRLRRGMFSLVEEKIPPGAKAVGVAVKDLPIPEQCVIAAIIRKGEIVIPRGITQFEVGDEVFAITAPQAADDLALLFGRPTN